MPLHDAIRVEHAVAAAERAMVFGGQVEWDALDPLDPMALAIVHLLEVVGEACNQVSRPFQEAHPEVPWEKAIALRHRLIHGYFDIDMRIVEATVLRRLPDLVRNLKACLAE